MIKETMTSRQRVLKAINHQKVDRMPIDLGVHFSTGISVFAYHNLRKYLGLDTEHIEMIDCVQGLARVDWDIIERFHIDTILLNPGWTAPYQWNVREDYRFWVPPTFRPLLQEGGGYRVDFKGSSMYMPSGAYFFDGAWPDFYDLEEDSKLNLFADNAKRIYEETDKFTMMMGFPGFFGGLDFACDMLLDPEGCKALNAEVLKESIEKFDRVNAKMGKYINAIEVNSDLGMQNAPMCSPSSYEECCLPYLKRFCSHVHQNSDIKIFMHSCGSIAQLLPYIIEAGVDIINPVQISASNMDPSHLKEKYGDKICFWGGGCDTQDILWKRTPEEISKHVAKLIQIFKKDSGFIFNQVHNIMGNVPPENIVALFDTAYNNSANET
jgi:uroporphyrinogen decarboxylase